jgi:hypothetical protein
LAGLVVYDLVTHKSSRLLKLLTQKKIVQSREKDLFFFRSVILNVSMNYGSKGLLDTGFIKTFKNPDFKKKSAPGLEPEFLLLRKSRDETVGPV